MVIISFITHHPSWLSYSHLTLVAMTKLLMVLFVMSSIKLTVSLISDTGFWMSKYLLPLVALSLYLLTQLLCQHNSWPMFLFHQISWPQFLWLQVNDFLTGRAPLLLAMKLGDHMMFVQLQLSNSSCSARRRHHLHHPHCQHSHSNGCHNNNNINNNNNNSEVWWTSETMDIDVLCILAVSK